MADVDKMAHWANQEHYRWGMMEKGSGIGDEDGEEEGEATVGRGGSVQHLADSCLASVFAVVVVS